MSYSIVEAGKDLSGALYSWLLSLCCSSAETCSVRSMTVNNRTFRVVRQLAEGGFSFVFLVESAGEKYALKKVLTQVPEQAEQARPKGSLSQLPD